jgi:hypothetical protein
MGEIAVTDEYRAVIPCDCGDLFCTAQIWTWDDEVVAWLDFGNEIVVMGLRNRLKKAWGVLRGRKVERGIALTRGQARELAEFMLRWADTPEPTRFDNPDDSGSVGIITS